jgi:PAS domain S-box-containing protein
VTSHVAAALFTAPDARPDWLAQLGVDARIVAPDDRAALRDVDLALVDAATVDSVSVIRRVRAVDAAIHLIIVAPAAQRAALERALLFAPGVGEVWIEDNTSVDADVAARAAGITRTRRSYQANRARIQATVSALPERRAPSQPHISDAYLAALLQVLPDPILSIDADGCVLSWSPAAANTLRLDPRRADGRDVTEIVMPAQPADFERLLEEGTRRTARADIDWTRDDGAIRTADVTVTPVDVAGHCIRAVVFRDTTEQRAAQRMLEEQATELEAQTLELAMQTEQLTRQRDELEQLAAERMAVLEQLREVVASRSRFYASMSHEIRTPINAILGYNDLILAGVYGEVAGRLEEGLQRSQAAARHLRELVDDVLDLSKIESGRIELVSEPVRLDELVREVAETLEPAAQESGSSIEYSLEHAPIISTDPRRVRQILLNLLSNAIKFGAGQPVEVASGTLAEEWAFIEVRDGGRGIAPEQLGHIFEEFVQLDSSETGGTGLGLAISKRLAIALGGSIGAASTPGAGSTFTLTLPLAR